MLYVGVDLHRKASQVAVVDEQGKLLFNRHAPSHREVFRYTLVRQFETAQDVCPELTP